MISFRCAQCGKSLKVNEELAGKKAKCPHCSQIVPIPTAATAASATLKPQDQAASARTRRTLGGAGAAQTTDDAATLPPQPRTGSGPLQTHSDQDRQAEKGTHGGDAAAAPVELTDFLAPPQAAGELGRLGPYRVLKVLGYGGMGAVFLAEDPQLQRKVALKVMLPALAASASAHQRFLREARAAAAIEHDHIVPIYQVGEDRSVPFLAMPLLKGEPLDNRLHRERTLPLAEVLRIGRETAEGLAAAHDHGLIHRDIKPANLWLEGAKGRVKILDFGLARSGNESGQQLTQTGAIVGTPSYMAPEQASGQKLDARCDLFSLGCVLYRLCTGELPFKGTDTISTLVAVATQTPRPPRELNSGLPPQLSDLVMQLLAKDPAGRPPAARAVVEAIQAIEEETPGAQPRTQKTRPGPAPKERSTLPWLPGKARVPPRALLIGGVALAVLLVVTAGMLFLRSGNSPGSGLPAEELPSGGPPGNKANLPSVSAGMPLSPWALVSQPAALKGVRGWTIDTRNHRGLVRVFAYSPDDRRLATGGEDGTIRLWHTNSEEVKRVLVRHNGEISALAWSPDGKTLASGGQDRTVRLWEAERGKLLHTLEGHAGAVGALAWSSDGKTLASGGREKTVRLWGAGDGKFVRALAGHPAFVVGLTWRPGNKTLLATCEDQTVHLWEPDSDKVLHSHKSGAHAAWSRDFKVFASTAGGKRVEFWEADTDRLLRTLTLQEQKNEISALAWSPDGKTLATGAERGVQFWDAKTGQHLGTTDDGHARKVHALAWSPDSETVASSGLDDFWVHLWKPGSKQSVYARLSGPINLGPVGWSPRGRVVFAWNGSTLGAWDPTTGKSLFSYAAHGDGTSLPYNWANTGRGAWSPDGTAVATRYWTDSVARVWDVKSGRMLRELGTGGGLRADVLALDWSPDGHALAISQGAAERFRIAIWDLKSGKHLGDLEGPSNWVAWLAWSPDSRLLASGGHYADQAPRIWDVATGKQLFHLKDQVVQSRDMVAWSPDSSRLLAGGAPLQLWDVRTGTSLKILQPGGTWSPAVAWSQDGRRLASGDANGVLHLWEAETGQLLKRITGHQGAVAGLAFLPGKRLASLGMTDQKVRFWEADRDEPVHTCTVLAHAGRFSPDGRTLQVAEDGSATRLWDTADGHLIAALLRLPGQPEKYLAASAGGHYRGTLGVEQELVYVIETDDGQEVLTPAQFEQKYGWKNQPDQVHLTAPD